MSGSAPATRRDDAVRVEDEAFADIGKMRCRCCHHVVELDRALSVWRNGQLVFGVCDDCCVANVLMIGATERGIAVHRVSRAAMPTPSGRG